MESGESTLGEENERNVQDSVRGELFEEKDERWGEEQSCELTVKREDNSVLEEETVGAGHHSRKTAACSNHFFTTTTCYPESFHKIAKILQLRFTKFSSKFLFLQPFKTIGMYRTLL